MQIGWIHLVAKCVTNASIPIWWPNWQLMQVVLSVAKFVTNASDATWKCMWRHLMAKFVTNESVTNGGAKFAVD